MARGFAPAPRFYRDEATGLVLDGRRFLPSANGKSWTPPRERSVSKQKRDLSISRA